MAIAHKFDGQGVTLYSPSGGTVLFVLGALKRTEESDAEAATAFRIVDKDGMVVTEFALTAGTLFTLMEAMKLVMEKPQKPRPKNRADSKLDFGGYAG